MVIWYRNSILASIFGIFGCSAVIAAIGGVRNGELEIAGAALMIAIGAGMVALGKWISVRKENKKKQQSDTKK